MPSRAALNAGGASLQGACVETGANSYDPSTGRVECIGTADWGGTLNGHSTYRAKGHVDLLTGDASGHVWHRFSGVDFADVARPSGEIDLAGSFTIDGRTGEEVAHLVVRRATGAFKGVHGSITWKGTATLSGGPALGDYSGSWWRDS